MQWILSLATRPTVNYIKLYLTKNSAHGVSVSQYHLPNFLKLRTYIENNMVSIHTRVHNNLFSNIIFSLSNFSQQQQLLGWIEGKLFVLAKMLFQNNLLSIFGVFILISHFRDRFYQHRENICSKREGGRLRDRGDGWTSFSIGINVAKAI